MNTQKIRYDGFYDVVTNMTDNPKDILKIDQCRWELSNK